ncbi:hypothetical protein PYCCODRAFT_1031721 [Trametes coccinea BRFM310]|uniref:F-box domain-containing protein n=1 Tax=Trametes coccinea (strain BRFM310) TaxID=1353009 RepID=A0A1Y2ICF6_TRAC3|nr:hypothetical protein PYCCODRAFT_1031721 [Trametes coccinea BRFM310]
MPPKKKSRQGGAVTVTRTTRRMVRGQRGSLRDLPEMPIDILTEIFSFLLDPRNVHIWRVCREGAEDIPPLPPFMSEPAYAHLLFAPFCHGCGKSPVHRVIWTWFTRYCTQCSQEQRGYIPSYPPFLEELPDRKILVKGLVGNYGEFLSLINPSDGHYGYQRYNNYHIPQLERFLVEWNAAGSSEARKELYEKQKASVAEMRKHEKILKKWWERRHQDHMKELNEIKEQRFSEICARLEDAGWGPELDRLRDTPEGQAKLRGIPILHHPSKLTDKAFEAVLQQLHGLLTATRSTLESEARQAKLEKCLQLFDQAVEAHFVQIPRTPRMLCRPRLGDFLFEPEVEALLTGPNVDRLTVGDFAPVIPTLASRWEGRIKDELRKMVRGQVERIPEDTDPLDLAVALFTCSRCYSECVMRYPEILAHHCLHTSQPDLDTQYCRDIQAATAKVGSSSLRFSCSNLRSTSISEGKEFLTVLGMSPATTTWDELVNQNVLLRRKTCQCYPGSSECGAYTWGAALIQSRRGIGCDYNAWRLTTPQELEAISVLGGQVRLTPNGTSWSTTWVCALCHDWSERGDRVEGHLKYQHQLENVKQCVEDGTVFIHPCDVIHAHGYPIPLPHVSESL